VLDGLLARARARQSLQAAKDAKGQAKGARQTTVAEQRATPGV
jgi:hypothetical protein